MADKPTTEAGPKPVRTTPGYPPRRGSAMDRLIRSHDWASTPLGDPAYWPQNLRSALDVMLESGFPMFIYWDRAKLTSIYNEVCRDILNDLYIAGQGRPAKETWAGVWDQLEAMVDSVFTEGKRTYRKDMRFEFQREGHPDEAYFTFCYSPIFNDNGTVDGLSCTFLETTEDVVSRQTLTLMNQSKDEFISLASHQLRTPATGVKQYLGMLLGNFAGEVTPLQRDFLEHAYDSNERQLTVVSDLLNVAQADAGRIDLHKRPVDLVELIDGVLDEQATKFIDRGQTVQFKHSQDKCVASIDKERLRMVLDNLVDNASKYTDTGSNKKIKVTLDKSPAGEITIRVKDQGVGVSKEDAKLIFEKFIRVQNPLSNTVGGNGLGLYLARKIVELHDGSLTVASTPGKGSTFIITLPA